MFCVTGAPQPRNLRRPRIAAAARPNRIVIGGAGGLVGGDTLPQRKPDPAPLLHACVQLGVAPGDALYVGDDLRDIQAAKAAGMPSAAAAWGYIGHNGEITSWEADVIVEQPLDLLNHLGT